MERGFLFIIAIALAFGVGIMGSKRKIGFGWAFVISLLNVVIGLIVVLCSKKLTPEELAEKERNFRYALIGYLWVKNQFSLNL